MSKFDRYLRIMKLARDHYACDGVLMLDYLDFEGVKHLSQYTRIEQWAWRKLIVTTEGVKA